MYAGKSCIFGKIIVDGSGVKKPVFYYLVSFFAIPAKKNVAKMSQFCRGYFDFVVDLKCCVELIDLRGEEETSPGLSDPVPQ